MNNVKIYSITYSQQQPCEYVCYDNSHIRTTAQKSYLFENNVIIDIIDNHYDSIEELYLGIFSWKFGMKTGIFPKKLYWLLEKNPDFDIYNFCRPLSMPYMLFTEKVHPGFLERFTYLLRKLDIPYCEPKNVVYSNFFIAKKEIYKDFVNTLIKPSITIMETDDYLKTKVFMPCNYNGLSSDKLKEFTGMEYYSFHTFVLERLFSFYLEQHKELKIWKTY